MVKKVAIFILLMLAVFYINYPTKPVNAASSFNEIVTGTPPNGIGELIASKGGFNIIEFWHYSGGYWKATMNTINGLKEIIIYDNEATTANWTDINFLSKKIYENEFVLEYKVWHPNEVLEALASGKEITPVMSIDTGTLCYSDEYIIPTRFFNYEPLSEGLN
ncbi:MAG: hypothetical protein PHG58_08385, partial [Clostridia bacterium]|nr:hypothetical protein [Clostridia bacterium]